jgi:malonate transporter and related proteins
MTTILSALAPVFLLIVIGWAARARGLVSMEAFGAVNRFGYFVLYPAFLFSTVAGAKVETADAGAFVAAVLLGFLTMCGLALLSKPAFKPDHGPAFTSFFQGVGRWNGFALLAAADSLFGPDGKGLLALAFGPVVLMVNVLCVAVLARWGAKATTSKRAIVDQILANPLILACAAGLTWRLTGWEFAGPPADTLKLLSNAAMPIALLCVGAGIDLKAARAGGAALAGGVGLKLLVAPMVLYASALALGVGPLGAAVAAGIGSTPTAAAAYTLAHEMGGDAKLMAAIVSATTLASFLTMPVVLILTAP